MSYTAYTNMAGGKKILMIDDEQVLLKVASAFFEEAGYDIKGILDPLQGYETARSWKPDIILLDIIMPGVNGLEILKKLMDDPETSSIPVFVFSNLDNQNEIAEAMETGAVEYLTKANYSLEDVKKKIEETISKH